MFYTFKAQAIIVWILSDSCIHKYSSLQYYSIYSPVQKSRRMHTDMMLSKDDPKKKKKYF